MAIARGTPLKAFLEFEGRVGVWSGETPPATYSDFINLEKLEVTAPAQDTIKLISRMHSSKGAALDSQQVPTDKVAKVAIEATTFTPGMIAMMTGGAVTEVVQTGAAVAAEVVTTVLNEWVPLANYGIAPDAQGTATSLTTSADVAVDDAKFVIDLELGMIKAIHADAVGVGMKLAYYTRTQTVEQYTGGLALSTYCHITGQCYERATGKLGTLDIWRACLSSAGTFSPIGKEYLKGALDGDLIIPPVAIRGAVRTAPWQWQRRTV
ncbi:hypothetical protein [uncultured Thiodictyon sp.]|uniref:phage tail tube protein n=1 Tax=uncultured Thiodictyon sp. TaxID=1846217 RepID=UPI0025E45B70|nr:hypothetical protein [uncultured Thiodictyon sp.]